jgi:hypothetical protein
MSTITVELTIKVKTKFTSSNAEKIKWIHLTTDVTQFSHLVLGLVFFAGCMMFTIFLSLVFLELVLILKGMIFIICW